MLDTTPHSDFWALQETHLSGRGRLATAQRWARRKGWATSFQTAEESGQHEAANRGGVALGGPTHISSEVPASFEATMDDAAFMAPAGVQRPLDYLRSRILARHFNAMLKGGVTLVTAYLEPGIKATGLNLWLLEALAPFCLGFDGPWIATGDWNMEPLELARSGWVDLVGGKVVAPDSVTCAGGAGSLIDYFVVSAAIGQLVQQVQVIDASPTTPHWPVKLTLKATSWGHRVLARRRPKSCLSGRGNKRPRSTGPGRRAASQRTSNRPGLNGCGQPRPLGAGSMTFAALSAGRIWEGAKGWSSNTSPLARPLGAMLDEQAAGRRRRGAHFGVWWLMLSAASRPGGRGECRSPAGSHHVPAVALLSALGGKALSLALFTKSLAPPSRRSRRTGTRDEDGPSLHNQGTGSTSSPLPRRPPGSRSRTRGQSSRRPLGWGLPSSPPYHLTGNNYSFDALQAYCFRITKNCNDCNFPWRRFF